MNWGKNSAKTAGWLAGAVVLVASFEGVVVKPYQDKLAYNILTVCAGETRNVDPNKIYTLTECKALLEKGLLEFDAELSKCIKVPMSDKTHQAIVSWAWNVGTGGACTSSVVYRLNRGDYKGACERIAHKEIVNGKCQGYGCGWAGGKQVKGLQTRRQKERDLCLAGI